MNIKKKTAIRLTFVLSGAVYIAAFFASRDIFILFKLLNYYLYICVINFIVVPLIIFISYSHKMGKSVQNQNQSQDQT